MIAYPYALQLYSVRDYMGKNPAEGFDLVKEAGYRYVETAGNYEITAFKMRNMMDASGLVPISMHIPFDEIVQHPGQVIENAQTLKVSYVVVPWLGGESCPDRNAWLEAAETMDDAGALLAREGLTLCYHNHAHEFERFGEETIFDLIFNNSDPENLKLELDMCWAAVAKANVCDILKHYRGRIPLVHVKDYKQPMPDMPVVFTELGKGMLTWQTLLPAALDAGARWFIVEQDESESDSMASAGENAAYLQRFNQQ